MRGVGTVPTRRADAAGTNVLGLNENPITCEQGTTARHLAWKPAEPPPEMERLRARPRASCGCAATRAGDPAHHDPRERARYEERAGPIAS